MAKRKSSSKNNSGGCLTVIIGFFIISLALFIYSFAWIPAIGALIYFATRKNLEPRNKKIRIVISSVVIITSLLLFIGNNIKPELENLEISISESEYDINDTPKLMLSLTPYDAEIEKLTISDNDIVELNYENDIASLSFKELGTVTFFVVADDTIESNKITLTIVDKEAIEAARLAAEEEERRQEEEAARLAAEEEAQRQAELEAQRQAELEAQQEETVDTEEQEPTVWITSGGGKYHSNSGCSNMKNPTEVTISQAESQGKEPCKKCY